MQTELFTNAPKFRATAAHEPDPEARITNPQDIINYAKAGYATFTLRGKSTHLTYKVTISKRMRTKPLSEQVCYVTTLTNQAGIDHWSLIGSIAVENDAAPFRFASRKSKIGINETQVKAFRWFWEALLTNNETRLAQLEFWHSGRCSKCGGRLTDPDSVKRGLGPVCRRKVRQCQR